MTLELVLLAIALVCLLYVIIKVLFLKRLFWEQCTEWFGRVEETEARENSPDKILEPKRT